MSDRATAGRRGRARGSRVENTVARELRADGWVVASMRTSLGGGDLMAAKATGLSSDLCVDFKPHPALRLVEVKSTAGSPWERFGPADREAMVFIAHTAGATAWLAYRPPGSTSTRWIPSEEWPK